MAKKDKDNVIGEENESGGSKLVTALIAIVIILIWNRKQSFVSGIKRCSGCK